jgi:HAD superfamily hydrolase (TIGR01509 family)
MAHELRGLLFDFDGTIAETERHGHRVAYNQAFAELGLAWTWDEALYGDLLRVAGGRERLRYYLARYHPERGDASTSELLEEIYRAKTRSFEALAPDIPLRPGVKRLISEAHAAGVRIAIATTASLSGVEALLSRDPALRQAIELIAAGDVVERKKPAPDIYEWALEGLGLAPEACVAIEDSNIGLRAALGAGLRTLVTVSDYTRGEDFSGAAAVLSSLGDDGEAARCLAGPAPPQGIVDVAYLRDIVSHSSRSV